MFAERAREMAAAFAGVRGLEVSHVQGAFYVTALFQHGALGNDNRLPIANKNLHDIVERQCTTAAPDARFVYHLLASTGICVVPLTGFYTPRPGFRFTLLETDDAKRAWIFKTVAESVQAYLDSDRGA
jgi:aspartate/methionine/tyrosine aminotransferase